MIRVTSVVRPGPAPFNFVPIFSETGPTAIYMQCVTFSYRIVTYHFVTHPQQHGIALGHEMVALFCCFSGLCYAMPKPYYGEFAMQPEFRAVYEDSETYGWVEQEELKWQAQWYSETSLNADKYERGGWYATEAEAIEAARRGKATMQALLRMVGLEG